MQYTCCKFLNIYIYYKVRVDGIYSISERKETKKNMDRKFPSDNTIIIQIYTLLTTKNTTT